jgi:hypothetical protein
MKSSVVWYVMPSSPLQVSQHFGARYHFHLQGGRVRQVRIQHEAGSKQLAGGNVFLQNMAEDRISYCYSHVCAF